ncbi:uncharacterized protein LOC142568187 [Dermacentor variabilis]|uniref:uncharacterized protein LOC142568187 n=1 Tax=Dermacentor variabilis TaxID=34621 RepID=UPI003F5BB49B
MRMPVAALVILMASCVPSFCFEDCPDPYEWKVRCRPNGAFEAVCEGAQRKPCRYSSYNPNKYKVCTCVSWSNRRKDGKCVLAEDCVLEKDLNEGQRREMDNARKLLNGTNRIILYKAWNGMARLTLKNCWSSVKSVQLNGGVRHNMTYIETSVELPLKPGTANSNDNMRKLGLREADWYVKPLYGEPSVVVNAWDGDTRDPDISGSFKLFAAEQSCLVMGTLRTSGNSMCFYWMDFTSLGQNHTKCEDAFFKKCSDIKGSLYSYPSVNYHFNCSFLNTI